MVRKDLLFKMIKWFDESLVCCLDQSDRLV